MFLVEIIPQKPEHKHSPMAFDNFGTLQASVDVTWSRSKFKGEIQLDGKDKWKIVEKSPNGTKLIAKVTKVGAVAPGTQIYKQATHL